MPKFRSLQKLVFEKNRLGGGLKIWNVTISSVVSLDNFRSKVGLSEIRSQRSTLT